MRFPKIYPNTMSPRRGGYWPECLGSIVIALVLLVGGFAGGFATAHASSTPDITCTTAYYLANDQWGNQSYAQPSSPYLVYMSTNQGPTKYCLVGSNSSKTFEQYGTSRCIQFVGNQAPEGDCSLARSHWTLTLYGHVYTIKNNYTGKCMYDEAGTALMVPDTCSSSNPDDVFHIA